MSARNMAQSSAVKMDAISGRERIVSKSGNMAAHAATFVLRPDRGGDEGGADMQKGTEGE